MVALFLFLKGMTGVLAPFRVECLFIEAPFHHMAFSSNKEFHLVFKTVSRISLAHLMKSRFDEKALHPF
jgi:hypothetical protein